MKYLIVALALGLFVPSFGQEVGKFQLKVEFNKDDYKYARTLYYYVPENYDASKSYSLVVGFRGGPHSNAGQFRDQLSFLADSLDAIILCPENIDHFNIDENLVKQLFKYSVDTTRNLYNIDTSYIYLTGLSFGGRHVVKVNMDTDDGEIIKLRGIIPFAAGRESENAPNYESIDLFAPACICIGLNDAKIFKDISAQLHNDITSNGGKSFLNEISGIGHTVDFAGFPSQFMKCIRYIEDQYMTTLSQNVFGHDKSIELSPNPTSNMVHIIIDDSLRVSNISIHSTDGKLVYAQKGNRSFPTEDLINGTYIVILTTTVGQIQKKLVVFK